MIRQLILWFTILSLALAPQSWAGRCRALVETPTGLAVSDERGRILSTVAPEAGPFVAAFAPNGRLIVYSPAQPATRIVLTDLKGRLFSETEVEQPAVTAVMRLGWAGSNRLWYEGHTGPHLGAFELWELPQNFDLSSRKVALAAYGHSCALSPDVTAVACLGTTPASAKQFILIRQASADPDLGSEEVYPDPPRDGDLTWRFEGGLAWSQDARRLAAVQRLDGSRWVLTLERATNGWQTHRQPLPEFSEPIERIGFAESGLILEGPRSVRAVSFSWPKAGSGVATESQTLPRRLSLAGIGEVPVLDWSCVDLPE